MSDSFQAGVERIVDVLDVDIAYLTPPEERRLDPTAVAELVGSLLLSGFLEAFGARTLDVVTGTARDLGRRARRLLLARGSKDAVADEVQSPDVEDLIRHARDAAGTAADATKRADAAEAGLREGLEREGVPAAVAARVARAVRQEASALT